MSRRKRLALLSVLLLGSLAGLTLAWRWWHRPLPPLEVGVWYWHHPYALSDHEAQQLRAAGVTQLYIRGGTFIRDQDRVRETLAQQWNTGSFGLETQLVFNFDYSVVRSFSQLDLTRTADAVTTGVRQALALARQAGLKPTGVQFDFDCATHSLPRYARLLKRLRNGLVGGNGVRQLSITALPTWYTSGAVRQVADAVDFMVPQYYEPRVAPMLNDFATISCLPMVRQGMQAAAGVGHPFRVGIPAYGHALMYDDHGKLVGLYRDMTAMQAAQHRSFRLARAYPSDIDGKPATRATAIGEDLLDFVAIQAAQSGKGLGYHLIYDLPTPDLVARHLALIRAERPRECRGVILFCYPEPDATLALPLPALCAALRSQHTDPRLTVSMKTRKAPWDLIETGKPTAHPPVNLSVKVTNVGDGNSFFATDAVTLTLHFDRPGLDELDARDFDGFETAYSGKMQSDKSRSDLDSIEAGRELQCSLPRADTIRVRKFQLRAGETARIGPIRVSGDGATRVWGTWSVRGPGGFDTIQGEIPPAKLVATDDEN
jgi:hypothetical protein